MLTKPAWMSEAVWRSMRTVFQVFAVAFGAALLVALSGYQTTHIFDATTLYFDGIVGGGVAVLAWLMNLKK